MSKAGKGDGVDAGAVGSQHPVPENIPHLSSPVNGGTNAPKHSHHGTIQAVSPVKESSFLNRETSADGSTPTSRENDKSGAPGASAAPEPVAGDGDGIPIRS